MNADNVKIEVMEEPIDETIYKGYRIYPINYIALDLLENTQRFQDKYTLDEVVAFEKYITTQLAKVEDVPNLSDDDMQYMRQMMLTMYANPLKNQLATI